MLENINTGDYVVLYFNKHGSNLRDLTHPAQNMQLAIDTGNRHLWDIDTLNADEHHILPTSFRVLRLVHNSEENK